MASYRVDVDRQITWTTCPIAELRCEETRRSPSDGSIGASTPKRRYRPNDYDLSINRYTAMVQDEVEFAAPAEFSPSLKNSKPRFCELFGAEW